MRVMLSLVSAGVSVLVPVVLLAACHSCLRRSRYRLLLQVSLFAVVAAVCLRESTGIVFVLLRPLPRDWYFVPAAQTLLAVDILQTVAWGAFCLLGVSGLINRMNEQTITEQHAGGIA